MDFFERAHVTRKEGMKKGTKTEQAVKKQLKQLLHAYKKGDNQEIRNFGEKEINYDTEDVKSVSEFSDFSYNKRAQTPSFATEDSHSNPELNNSSSSSRITTYSDTVNENLPDSLESNTCDIKYPSTEDDSTNNKDFSSTFDSSIISEAYSDSDISIPSSLQSSGSNLSDDDEFDHDGALALKILDNLSSKQMTSNKKKLSEGKFTQDDRNFVKQEIKQSKKGNKKLNKINEFNKEPFTIAQSNDHLKHPKQTEKEKKHMKKLVTEKKESKNLLTQTKYEDDLNHSKEAEAESLKSDSGSTDFSPYISVSATDMQSLSLNDIVGDYIHSTVKNLPSQKQHIVHTPLNKYTILDEMISGEVAEDISSIVPEIDEELEELTLDSESPGIITGNENFEDNPFVLYNGRNNHILIMKHPAELYIHGKVKISAFAGSVEIFGYTLQNECVNIYAPYCYYAHCIKTNGKSNKFHGIFSKLINAGLTKTEAKEIVSTVNDNDAIISLSNLNDPKIDFIDTNFSTSELFSRRNDQTPEFLKKTADNLGCSLYLNQPKKILEERATWEEVVSCGMNVHSRGIVCGGKGLGKSTFLRYYINRLLTNGPVLVIDLDPGQAEFTVPGNISASVVDRPLIGPNFTHLRTPDRMINIGMINTMDQPFRYISAINQLITHCQRNEEYQNMPWIVNTMGMCNDIGLKFLTYTILQLNPTFLYQIDSDVPKKRFQFDLQPHMIKIYYENNANDKLLVQAKNQSDLDYKYIKSSFEETKRTSSGMSPSDERYLNVLAYFSRLVEQHHGKGILEIVPYEVNIRDLNIGVNVNIPRQYLTKVINGKIIALCQLPTADKGEVFNLRDDALLCHGYGLIRSIDFSQGILYILTPVSIGTLSLVNTLVYADWMPELHGLENDLPNGTVIPYRLSTLENPAVMTRPRRRFNPLQLIKATRNA